jgi:hypothetical protein|nr:MAG TPA: hypothetical protein [Caudoviricetes sp.]
MTLFDLLLVKQDDDKKYNFLVVYRGKNIISTDYRITFLELTSIIGLDLVYMEIEPPRTNESNDTIKIIIKDS